jgi:hypothetical protein
MDILTGVLDAWKSAVDAHDPKRVAASFTEDAIFSQPRGMTAQYRIVETRRLADDVLLGYASVDFAFTDRETISVHLSVIVRRVGEAWLIAHYQVSRL